MKDEEYIVNNKIYNLTKSTKLYEYVEKESTGRFIGSFENHRDVNVGIYIRVLKVIYIKLSRE